MDQVAILFVRHRLLLAFFVLSYTGICLYGIGCVRFESDPGMLFKSDKLEYPVAWRAISSPLERTALIELKGTKLLTSAGLDVMSRITQGAGRIEGVEAVFSMRIC